MTVRRRILLVDDEDAIRDALSFVLEKNGYRVLAVATGAAAFEAAAEETFELIILDLMLPDINGTEICSQLHHDHNHSRHHLTPILIMTSYSNRDAEQKALQAGAAAFMTKPLKPNHLLTTLATLTAPATPGAPTET